MCSASEDQRDKVPVLLKGVPATLLIPLSMRAAETQRPDAIIRDPKAIEILQSLDYDCSQMQRLWMRQIDIAVRTEVLDRATTRFLTVHPVATVVTLGAGLDGRFWRVDNGKVAWFDLDLPEVVELRRRFFTESQRNRFIAKSLLDFAWIDDVKPRPGQPLLIIAEGVLPYFEEAQVRGLFREIADRLPGAELLFHSTSPYALRRQPRSAVFHGFDARFRWGISTGREVEKWDSRYEFLAEWALVDEHPCRWRWVRYAAWLPWIGQQWRAAMKITHVRFRPPG